MKKQRCIKIYCPNCQAQYLPCEVYLPNHFLGKAKYVEKDIFGKILNFYGTDQDLVETYTCDKCNKTFQVRAFIQFDTKILEDNSFDDDYCTKISKKLTLKEN